MNFYKYICWWSQVYYKFKEYEKNFEFKTLNVMKLMSKTRSGHLLLSIIFNDKF